MMSSTSEGCSSADSKAFTSARVARSLGATLLFLLAGAGAFAGAEAEDFAGAGADAFAGAGLQQQCQQVYR